MHVNIDDLIVVLRLAERGLMDDREAKDPAWQDDFDAWSHLYQAAHDPHLAQRWANGDE